MVAMLEGTEVKMKMEIVMAMKKDKLVSDMDKNNSFVEEVVVEVEVETIIGGWSSINKKFKRETVNACVFEILVLIV